MTSTPFGCPEPRPAVADPALTRPDWTREETRDGAALWLDKNENSDPALAAIVADVAAAIPPEARFCYPEPGPLYAKLATYLGVGPENLILAAGSDGAIRAVFEAYVSPGDVVVHTRPTFAMYAVYCRMYGARARPVEYLPSETGPQLDAGTIIDAIRDSAPRVVCLPNPDSPTGTMLPPAALQAVVEAAGAAGAVMLIDEAYFPFYAETALPWIDTYGHLVVTRSTGKAWGLAGFRIGYAAAAAELATVLHKVRPMYETGTVAMAVFERMLDHVAEMEASVRRLTEGKALFLEAMQELGFRTTRSHGNFMHVAFADAVHRALAGLVYYRRDFAEPCLKGFSRFSATTPERFRPVIERIREAVR